jgi:hypothetical protein
MVRRATIRQLDVVAGRHQVASSGTSTFGLPERRPATAWSLDGGEAEISEVTLSSNI